MSLGLIAAALAAASPSCADQSAMLRDAARKIEQLYVDPRQGREIAEQVRAWAKSGRYSADCGDPAKFLDRFNTDLDAYDGHFYAERAAAEGTSDDWLMAWRADGPKSNMGIREVRILEGNIGYLRLASFYPWDMAREKMEAAWLMLRDADALILDLRQNGGGDADTAEHIVRSALGPSPAAVQRIDRRSSSEPDQLPAAGLPAIRPGVPISVLVDRRSASASEFVAYSLQAAGRATIVGSRSAGAASILGDPVPLGGGYQISIPDARPVNLVTGSSWDRHGVRPDLPGGDDPLFVARRALERPKPPAGGTGAAAN